MSTEQTTSVHIRPATPDDVNTIQELILALAEYEKLTHMVKSTPEMLHTQLFGPRPAAEAVIAEIQDQQQQVHRVGFALFFPNFSTFLAQPGLYLEDLFVLPQWRGYGIGKALLQHLAGIAVERNYGRFEWSVLDWNQPAIDFYHAAGAQMMQEWRICRVTGEALQTLAKGFPAAK